MRCVLCSTAVETTSEVRAQVHDGLRRIEGLLPDPAATARVALRREGPWRCAEVSIPAGRTVLWGRGLARGTGTALDLALASLEEECRSIQPAQAPRGA